MGFAEYKSLSIYNKFVEKGIANSTLLSVAPTGATGLLMGANAGGIEPIFSFKYTRNIRGKDVDIMVPEYANYIKKHPNEELPEYFVTTADLTVEDHYAIQKAASKYVDLAISKTINLSRSDTTESVMSLLFKAWDERIVKGLTIFNPFMEKAAVLKLFQVGASSKKKSSNVIERGTVVEGETRKLEYHGKKIYITINYTKRNEPIECFISCGDPGAGELQSLLWALGYFISNQFKYGLPLNKMFTKMMNLKSFDRIATGSKVYSSLVEMIFSEIYDSVYTRTKDKSLALECPVCHEKTLISEGGCFKCLNCSYAKC
jgi:ribonucleoside-diphosphate reductase alpha chain